MKCKYCEKKGTYSFGWLDRKGEWQDKHYTCDDHAPLSIGNQEVSLGLEQLRQRSENFGKIPKSLLSIDSA